jgi:uncharacterized membrane protein
MKRRDFIPSLVVAALCLALWWLPAYRPDGEQGPQMPESEIATALVLSTDDAHVGQYGLVRQGEQRLELKLLGGRSRGRIVRAMNLLKGDMEFDHFYRVGEKVLVTVNYRPDGTYAWTHPNDPFRLGAIAWLTAAFFALLLLVCGWTGVKAVLSFVFAALVIWKVMVPLFIVGVDPVPVALALVALLSAGIMLLVGGANRKGLVALLGCCGGLVVTCVLSLCLCEPFHLQGAVRPFAKTLVMRFPELNITRLFLAGIFVAASGAVMDLAMDVAAALAEIDHKRPGLSRRELFVSGLRVARSVIGTMTTTLLFAYSGGYMMAMMWFTVQEIPAAIFVNTPFMAGEILNTLAGSFGLVTVGPLTALSGAVLFGRHPREIGPSVVLQAPGLPDAQPNAPASA